MILMCGKYQTIIVRQNPYLIVNKLSCNIKLVSPGKLNSVLVPGPGFPMTKNVMRMKLSICLTLVDTNLDHFIGKYLQFYKLVSYNT